MAAAWLVLLLCAVAALVWPLKATCDGYSNLQTYVSGASTWKSQISCYAVMLPGSIPTYIGDLTALTEIDIGNNVLTGTIPTELGLLTSLVHLNMEYNGFTGTVPTELGLLTGLTHLSFAINNIRGTLPTELGNLKMLQVLSTGRNNLNGTLPPELGSLTALREIALWFNDLTGTIPSELGKMTALRALDLSGYDLSGTLPTELGNLTLLSILKLGANNLIGTMPAELARLSGLTSLQLDDNIFVGTLPEEWSAMTRLRSIKLLPNCLVGIVPLWVGNVSITDVPAPGDPFAVASQCTGAPTTSPSTTGNTELSAPAIASISIVLLVSYGGLTLFLQSERRKTASLSAWRSLGKAPAASQLSSQRMSSAVEYEAFLTHDWGTDEYGRNNHSRVSRVNTALHRAGLETWFDGKRLTGNIPQQISDGIERSRIVIVFITQAYMCKVMMVDGYDYCRDEFIKASREKKAEKMVPVVMEPRMLDPSTWRGPLSLTLGSRMDTGSFVDFSTDAKLVNNMGRLLELVQGNII